MAKCFHCGLPASGEFQAEIEGQTRQFCCFGCQAVAQTIVSGGLRDFYQYRDSNNLKIDQTSVEYESFDLEEVQEDFVTVDAQGRHSAKLNIGGITCVACAWLIEKHLQKFEAVESIRVQVSSHTCELVWDRQKKPLSEILFEIARIGYRPYPAIASDSHQFTQRESRKALVRLGVAGIAMMQIGMMAIALHAGAIQGIESKWQDFLRWISLLFSVPVIFFSAGSFFRNAWQGLKLKSLNMDVPVSLALGLAFVASTWATFSGVGDVYFDSIAMFTFFLLLGRYLEMQARHSNLFNRSQQALFPLSVERVIGENRELVALKRIKAGDLIWVGAGDLIPCDGMVKLGMSQVDESFLTGESAGIEKQPGDKVMAGSLNGDTALTLLVESTGTQTSYASVEKLVQKGLAEKPPIAVIADTVASYFIFAVLIVAVFVGGYWAYASPDKAIWILLSVLVVTCPCALSLATPTALTVGANQAKNLGLLVQTGRLLEGLTKVDHVVFDKTGTLTQGKMGIEDTVVFEPSHREEMLQIIATLEKFSSHPVARAFEKITTEYHVKDAKVYASAGVEGVVSGECFRFGNIDFILPWVDTKATQNIEAFSGSENWHWLASKTHILGGVCLDDVDREGVADLLAYLNKKGISFSVLSGDKHARVEDCAKKYSIEEYVSQATPETKLRHITKLQARGLNVLMVGDGINDAPVLGKADVSIAIGSAAQIAKTHADAILLNDNLGTLVKVFYLAQKIKLTIKQNLMWALGYNAIALPAAAIGWIPPYLAALGMSLSSLIVVLNALRLGQNKKR